MSRFAIKYATRGRPELFMASIENIQSTIETSSYRIFVSADLDDKSMNNDYVISWVRHRPGFIDLSFGESKTKIQAINHGMEAVLDDGFDILINMSDDMRFVQQSWDQIMERRIYEIWVDSLDFFAHFNDGFLGDKLPTMSIMGRKYFERDGYIYHPAYKSFSCDAEALYVAQIRERYHYFPEVLFKHQHPAYGLLPNDATYTANSLHTPHDTSTYFERLKNFFEEQPNEYWRKFLTDLYINNVPK